MPVIKEIPEQKPKISLKSSVFPKNRSQANMTTANIKNNIAAPIDDFNCAFIDASSFKINK
jgi:hypothetical protein